MSGVGKEPPEDTFLFPVSTKTAKGVKTIMKEGKEAVEACNSYINDLPTISFVKKNDEGGPAPKSGSYKFLIF